MTGETLRSLTATASGRIALVVAVFVGLGLCAVPLFGVTGAESALVLGVVLPPLVAAVCARHVIRGRNASRPVTSGTLLMESLCIALSLVAVPVLILTLNGFRVRNCTPLEGLVFMGLGPAFGGWLAAWVSVAVALTVPRARWAQAIAVLIPVVTMLVGAYHLYDTPAVFAYNHFAGYLPGTLYDELISVSYTYATFRVETLALIAALGFAVTAGFDGTGTRLRWASVRALPFVAASAGLCLAGAVAIQWHGERLGHATSTAFMTEALGARVWGPRCTVVVPREMDLPTRRRMLEDCEFRLSQAEATLGVRSTARVTAFMFRSAGEKKRLMGAGSTYVAKPWRREVYLQPAGFPHPVLFHELTHVVAGDVASGPFKVSGTLRGLWPAPGLIEGLAVAVAWDARDGLTPHEWARAMLDLKLLPPIQRMLGLGFLAGSASRAYVASGSFLRFLLDTRGSAVVAEAYRTGDLEHATGQPVAALEKEWRAFLLTVPLREESRGLARMRFEPSGMFSAVCPHRVAALAEELDADLAANDARHARSTCEAILAIDPNDPGTRAAYVETLASTGEIAAAAQELARLVGPPSAPAPVVAAAREAVADEAWRRGDTQTAQQLYRTILSAPTADESARPLEVKLAALAAGGAQAELVFDILVGRDRGQTPAPVVVERAEKLRTVRSDGLGAYLLARQLINVGRPELALPYLDEAVAKTLPGPRLTKEAARLQAVALFLAARYDEARTANQRLRDAADATVGEQLNAQEWLNRIQWKQSQH